MYAQLESAMPADYLVACACDEIVMPESGMIMLPGVHAEATFYKGLFEKVGIDADFMHVGDFKGAAEPLTREKYSEPVRENMTALIDSLYDEMVTTVVKDRPLSVAQVKEIIDTGLITAKRGQGARAHRSHRLPRYAPRTIWPKTTTPSRSCTSRTTARRKSTPISPARWASSS